MALKDENAYLMYSHVSEDYLAESARCISKLLEDVVALLSRSAFEMREELIIVDTLSAANQAWSPCCED